MPLSARSPTGPLSLVGMDLAAIEGLKHRNRREKLFTAKCCGAPVQIRVAAGKIPHFVHLATPANCDGDKGETQEHLSLKASIAAAVTAAGWDVEVEAAERDAEGALIWRADVLATRGQTRVAFEAQLSRPDWSEMLERQQRYARSGVRGLWFVGTRKPFPTTKELPVFRVDDIQRKPTVFLRNSNEWPDHWGHTRGKGGVALADFVAGALSKRLVWAPYVPHREREAACKVSVFASVAGRCNGCGRILLRPHALTMKLPGDEPYPHFVWHRDMPPQPSYWVTALLERAKSQADAAGKVSLQSGHSSRCGFCGTLDSTYVNPVGLQNHLNFAGALPEMPQARQGTREWVWLHRWVLQP